MNGYVFFIYFFILPSAVSSYVFVIVSDMAVVSLSARELVVSEGDGPANGLLYVDVDREIEPDTLVTLSIQKCKLNCFNYLMFATISYFVNCISSNAHIYIYIYIYIYTYDAHTWSLY